MSWFHRRSADGTEIPTPKASWNSTPARRHAGCGQAASTSKDQLPGAVETFPGPGRPGKRVRAASASCGTGTLSSATDGCRIATTSEYYRSIYSTIAGDATRCSSSIRKYAPAPFRPTVEQMTEIPGENHSNIIRPAFAANLGRGTRRPCGGILAHVGTNFQTVELASACPGRRASRHGAPPHRGWTGVPGTIPNSPRTDVAPRPGYWNRTTAHSRIAPGMNMSRWRFKIYPSGRICSRTVACRVGHGLLDGGATVERDRQPSLANPANRPPN